MSECFFFFGCAIRLVDPSSLTTDLIQAHSSESAES